MGSLWLVIRGLKPMLVISVTLVVLLVFLDRLGTATGSLAEAVSERAEVVARLVGLAGKFERARVWPAPRTVTASSSWQPGLEQAGGRWWLRYLPDSFTSPGPLGLSWADWMATAVLLGLSWLLGRVVARATRSLLGHAVRRTPTQWDDMLLARLGAPITVAGAALVLILLLTWLPLHPTAGGWLSGLGRGTLFFSVFWAVVRALDTLGTLLMESSWAQSSGSSRSLISLGVRVAKVALVLLGVIWALSLLGYPVGTLVAGLGIGGVALALAAQKTVENLFGAVSLAVDQPIRVGDLVRLDELLGTVEAIGLRSTRLRTLDRTVVAIPNGKLAEMRIENLSARDRMRLACTLGLVYGTSAEQMREVLAGLERVLREHPKIWPDSLLVRFKQFGPCSLDIEVMAWFVTQDWSEFCAIRQELLLEFMAVVERAGTALAFPTQTVHLIASGARDRKGNPVPSP